MQPIENVRKGAGQDVFLTVYMKADSARSVDLKLRQDFGSGGSADVETALGTIALTTSFQKITFGVKLPSISGKTIGTATTSYLGLIISLPLNTTMTIDISQVDLKTLDISSAFDERDDEDELRRCQRYFEVHGGLSEGTPRLDQGWAASGAVCSVPVYFKVEKRAIPTLTKNGTWAVTNCAQPAPYIPDTRAYLLYTIATADGAVVFKPDGADDTVVADARIPL